MYGLLELKLQAVVSHQTRVLRTGLGSAARATLNVSIALDGDNSGIAALLYWVFYKPKSYKQTNLRSHIFFLGWWQGDGAV